MLYRILMLVLVGTHFGCASKEVRQQRKEAREQAHHQLQVEAEQKMHTRLLNHCLGFGFKPETDAMAYCLMQTQSEWNRQIAAEKNRSRQAREDLGNSLENLGNAISPKPKPAVICTNTLNSTYCQQQ